VRPERILDRVAVDTTWRWPVTHRLPVPAEQADLAMRYLHRRLADSGLPATLGLVMRGGPGGLRAWLTASTLDGADPAVILRLAGATVRWLGLGGTEEGPLDPVPGVAARFSLEPARSPRVLITPEAAVFGEFLGTTTHPWQLTVALGFSAGGDGEGDVDLGLSLVGDALDLSVATGLLSGDVAGDSGVRIVPRFLHGDEAAAAIDAATAGRAPAAGRVPEGVAARLLSLPARTIGTWPVVEAPPAPPEAVIGAARNAVPPHVLVQGGSGQGKTTFLEHLVDAGLEDGAAIVVVCPHGDLASRAAARIARAGAPLRVIDYGANDPVPWNLTVPDPGIGLEEHASLLTDVVRGLWLEGKPRLVRPGVDPADEGPALGPGA
jgi:hypothetical protein